MRTSRLIMKKRSGGEIGYRIDLIASSSDTDIEEDSVIIGGEVSLIPICSLLPSESPRIDGEDPNHVRLLAETDAPLPPILVHRSTMRVIDGMHRLQAARMRGDEYIETTYFDGDEHQAFVLAVKLNSTHGKPLSVEDRTAAATRIIATFPGWSDRRIASTTCLAAKTVAAIRRRSTADAPQLNARLGRDGRLRPVDPVEGRLVAGRLIKQQPQAPLRDIAQAAGIAVATARDVRQRVFTGQDVLPPRLRPRQQDDQEPASPTSEAPSRAVRHDAPTGRRQRDPAADSVVVDTTSVLGVMRRDPSLRMSEPGRRLLRLLSAHPADREEWELLVEGVPSHHADTVAAIARLCAEAWSDFAQRLGNCH